MNRILQITSKKFPPEIRVDKEARTLREAGFDSAVLSPPFSNQSKYEEWNGINIFRPNALKNVFLPLDKMIFQSVFFSPYWFKGIKEAIKIFRPDVLHVHDIWLGRTVLMARSNQKIVLDLHENMPAAVVEYAKGYKGSMKYFYKLFKNKQRILLYERSLLNKSDRILTVVEEARKRVLLNHSCLNSDKVLNIENLESKRFIHKIADDQNAFESNDYFCILYIGGFGPHRGIDTLIQSMAFLKKWGLNLNLLLVGAKEGDYLKMLKKLIIDLNVTELVNILNWIPSEKVLSYISRADIGCVPHHSNAHTDNTIPHKLFQYMIAKTPVLVSDSPPLARTVLKANSGLIFRAGDPEDCALKIRQMYDDRISLKAYAENGLTYVIDQGHNWEDEVSPRLVNMYNNLLSFSFED